VSKRSKTKSKEKRKREKAARKASTRAVYEGYRDKGINQKSKRALAKGQRKGPRLRLHKNGACGNPGCAHCYGLDFAPFVTKLGKPENMPQWMWQMWRAL
jgi:hypothetical protein